MDNNCPLNYLIIIRYFEKRNDFLKNICLQPSFYCLHNGCIEQGNYTFVVKDSLCLTGGIQGMSRRNFLYTLL